MVNCKCTYPGCDKRGKCEECVEFHRDKDEFPACFFSAEAERSFDRVLNLRENF